MDNTGSSAKAAMDTVNGPVGIAAGEAGVGTKHVVRKEKKKDEVMARLDAIEQDLDAIKQKLERLDIIDSEMETLRPVMQAMCTEDIEKLKRYAILDGDLDPVVLGPYSDQLLRTGYQIQGALNGDPVYDTQQCGSGVGDDGYEATIYFKIRKCCRGVRKCLTCLK